MNTLSKWNNFKKYLLRYSSFCVWIIGGFFSFIGFTNGLHTEWYWMAIALTLAVVINALELALNSEPIRNFINLNMDVGDIVLVLGGIGSYIYDIWTNILGLSVLMYATNNLATVSLSQQIAPILIGVLLAILPEPMYVKSLKMGVASIPSTVTPSYASAGYLSEEQKLRLMRSRNQQKG